MSEQEMQFADPDWQPSRYVAGQQIDSTVGDAQPGFRTGNQQYSQKREEAGTQNYQFHSAQRVSLTKPGPRMSSTRETSSKGSHLLFWVLVFFVGIFLVSSMMSGFGSGPSRSFSGNFPDIHDGRFSDASPFTHSMGSDTSLVMSNLSGSITIGVADTDSNSVEVNANGLRPDQVQFSDQGGVLTVELAHSATESKDITLLVPSQIALNLSTSGGSINVSGFSGQLSATTDSGVIDLEGDNLSGSSSITTATGDIHLENGSVSDGSSTISTTGGSLTLEQEELGGSVALSASSKNLSFTGSLDPNGEYTFTTVSGNINLALPADTSLKTNVTPSKYPLYNNAFHDAPRDSLQATVNVKTQHGHIVITTQ